LIVFLWPILRGYTGFGFALAAIPALSLVIEPVTGVLLVRCLDVIASLQLLPNLAIDSFPVSEPAHARVPGRYSVGIYGLAALPPNTMLMVIALIVLASVGGMAAGFKVTRQPGKHATLAVGAFSGFLNGGAQ
jgi:hypothetical protein